jgi:hypothetical protein
MRTPIPSPQLASDLVTNSRPHGQPFPQTYLHRDISFCPPSIDCRMRACLDPRTMTPLPAKVTAIGKQGQQISGSCPNQVQISWLCHDSRIRKTKTAHRFLERKSARSGLLSEPRSERGRSISPLDSPLKGTKARAERRCSSAFADCVGDAV